MICMGKSYRKHPICGHTCTESEKRFKQFEHRRERAAVRSGKEYVPASWGPKDGKQWLGDLAKTDPKLMRK